MATEEKLVTLRVRASQWARLRAATRKGEMVGQALDRLLDAAGSEPAVDDSEAGTVTTMAKLTAVCEAYEQDQIDPTKALDDDAAAIEQAELPPGPQRRGEQRSPLAIWASSAANDAPPDEHPSRGARRPRRTR